MVGELMRRRDEDRPDDPAVAPRRQARFNIARKLESLRGKSGLTRHRPGIAKRGCADATAMQKVDPSRQKHVPLTRGGAAASCGRSSRQAHGQQARDGRLACIASAGLSRPVRSCCNWHRLVPPATLEGCAGGARRVGGHVRRQALRNVLRDREGASSGGPDARMRQIRNTEPSAQPS
jgi:hypothetical protein